MSKRPLVLAAASLYVSAMIGLVGGIGVMAAGLGEPQRGSGHEVGFALIMILSK